MLFAHTCNQTPVMNNTGRDIICRTSLFATSRPSRTQACTWNTSSSPRPPGCHPGSTACGSLASDMTCACRINTRHVTDYTLEPLAPCPDSMVGPDKAEHHHHVAVHYNTRIPLQFACIHVPEGQEMFVRRCLAHLQMLYLHLQPEHHQHHSSTRCSQQ